MRTNKPVVDGRKFEMLGDHELPAVLQDFSLRRCWFFACHYGMTAQHPTERRRIVNVEVLDCKATNTSALGSAVLEDVDVVNLQTGGLCFVHGAVFKHVRLRGRCGRFLVGGQAWTDPVLDAPFAAANQEFYRSVDWALDISEGEFQELELHGVPADLVRRDPETQMIVRRDRGVTMEPVWRGLDLSGTPWPLALSHLLASGEPDCILVAAKRSKSFPRLVAGLRLLRDAGVAES